MGVKKCDRVGCENIMCDRHSTTYGYICEECFEEMKHSHMTIGMFMSTNKKNIPRYNYEEEFKLPEYEE